MKTKFNKSALANMLAPVLPELELNRSAAGQPSDDGRVEFLMRRMAAKMAGVNFTNLGLALDDLRAARAHLAKADKPGLGDIAAVRFAVDSLEYWEMR